MRVALLDEKAYVEREGLARMRRTQNTGNRVTRITQVAEPKWQHRIVRQYHLDTDHQGADRVKTAAFILCGRI